MANPYFYLRGRNSWAAAECGGRGARSGQQHAGQARVGARQGVGGAQPEISRKGNEIRLITFESFEKKKSKKSSKMVNTHLQPSVGDDR